MCSPQLSEALYKSIEKKGFQGQIVSIAHLRELQIDIETHHKNGLLDKELYDAYLASFDFECQRKLAGAKSLIIISVPQPQVRIMFAREDKSYPVIIPPTYYFSTDDQVANLLETHLGPQGYRIKKGLPSGCSLQQIRGPGGGTAADGRSGPGGRWGASRAATARRGRQSLRVNDRSVARPNDGVGTLG